jgi:hypothetical protein
MHATTRLGLVNITFSYCVAPTMPPMNLKFGDDDV